jgi:hypothetical protein
MPTYDAALPRQQPMHWLQFYLVAGQYGHTQTYASTQWQRLLTNCSLIIKNSTGHRYPPDGGICPESASYANLDASIRFSASCRFPVRCSGKGAHSPLWGIPPLLSAQYSQTVRKCLHGSVKCKPSDIGVTSSLPSTLKPAGTDLTSAGPRKIARNPFHKN